MIENDDFEGEELDVTPFEGTPFYDAPQTVDTDTRLDVQDDEADEEDA